MSNSNFQALVTRLRAIASVKEAQDWITDFLRAKKKGQIKNLNFPEHAFDLYIPSILDEAKRTESMLPTNSPLTEDVGRLLMDGAWSLCCEKSLLRPGCKLPNSSPLNGGAGLGNGFSLTVAGEKSL